jgi:hypothetical protein
MQHYSQKRVTATPNLLVSPFLAGATHPAVPEIISAYLNTPDSAPYAPEMGYAASLFATFMAPGRAFTAFWQLMRKKHHSLAFTQDGVEELAEVWNKVLDKRAPEIRGRLLGIGVKPEDYLIPWTRSIFLSIPFTGDLMFRLIDRIVDRGLKAVFEIALMIVISMRKGIQSGTKASVLEILENPAKNSFFGNWANVIKQLDGYRVTRKEYDASCPGGQSKKNLNKKKKRKKNTDQDKDEDEGQKRENEDSSDSGNS